MISTEFLLTSLVVVLIPGTGVIYTVSNGILLGWRQAVAAAIGCTFGIVPHLLASIIGLSALLHECPCLFLCQIRRKPLPAVSGLEYVER